MKQLSTGMIITAAVVVITYTHATAATQNPALSAPPPAPASIGEDSGPWRRDPFIGSSKKGNGTPTPAAKGIPPKSVTGVPKPEPNIHLQGIMQTDKRFHALINGRSVKAGDTIDGVTVKQISRYQVVLLNENKETITYDIYQGRIDRGKQ